MFYKELLLSLNPQLLPVYFLNESEIHPNIGRHEHYLVRENPDLISNVAVQMLTLVPRYRCANAPTTKNRLLQQVYFLGKRSHFASIELSMLPIE
ncbi:MAG TPA: hypothetical protein V6C91_19090 [Coleofasciculaceae cyanobacterium]